jgi:hypothetical protein
MLIANVDLPAAHQRVEQEGRWRTSDPDDASIAVDAQATRRQCAPCFAAPIRGGAATHRRIRIAPHPARARIFVGVRSTRSSSNSLVLCSGSNAQSYVHRVDAAPGMDRLRQGVAKYSCGHPNTPRGAGSSEYFQDVARGRLCVQSRSHFSLRLLAFQCLALTPRLSRGHRRKSQHRDCLGTSWLTRGVAP